MASFLQSPTGQLLLLVLGGLLGPVLAIPAERTLRKERKNESGGDIQNAGNVSQVGDNNTFNQKIDKSQRNTVNNFHVHGEQGDSSPENFIVLLVFGGALTIVALATLCVLSARFGAEIDTIVKWLCIGASVTCLSGVLMRIEPWVRVCAVVQALYSGLLAQLSIQSLAHLEIGRSTMQGLRVKARIPKLTWTSSFDSWKYHFTHADKQLAVAGIAVELAVFLLSFATVGVFQHVLVASRRRRLLSKNSTHKALAAILVLDLLLGACCVYLTMRNGAHNIPLLTI